MLYLESVLETRDEDAHAPMGTGLERTKGGPPVRLLNSLLRLADDHM
jgi:hypothetical protein